MPFTVDGKPLLDARSTCPQWADLDALRSLVLRPWSRADEPPPMGHHPLFEPWRDQIHQTAALEGAILFGAPVTSERVSRAGEAGAWLTEPTAPSCGSCGEPLTFCIQLTEEDLRPWLSLDGMLTVAYCFDCHPESSSGYDTLQHQSVDGRRGCRITVEQPVHFVTLREGSEPARRLALAPRWDFPDLSFSADRFGEGAATVMCKWVITPSVDVAEEYAAMVAERHGYTSKHVQPIGDKLHPDEVWRTAVGGYPSWDQEDVTPNCDECHAPMALLLDYNGHQFLDGALHVFTCVRTETCRTKRPFSFVAEF